MLARQILCIFLLTASLSVGVGHAADAPADPQTPPAAPNSPPPQANDPTPPPTGARKPSVQRPEDTIVCKKSDPPVGSRIGGRKICRTAAQWRAAQEASREYVDEVQSRARTSEIGL